MAHPLVSVVIPVFNAERYLALAIQSALAQTYAKLEIIVVNDGSTDRSRRILSQFESKIRIIDQENWGQGAARNRGVEVSSGELIAFLDSDDLWEPGKIAAQVEVLSAYSDALATYCDVRRIDSNGQVIETSEALGRSWPSGKILIPLIRARAHVNMTPSQVMVRKSAFQRAGGFPVELRQAEDYALWLKLACDGPIVYQLQTLVSYRRHALGISVEAGCELGWLKGRFAAILGIKGRSPELAVGEGLDLYRQEVFQAANALGWFLRKQGRFSEAAEAYDIAKRIRPASVRTAALAVTLRLAGLIRDRHGAG